MANLDDIIESFREEGREDEAGELEKLRGSTLRKQAENASKLEKENVGLKAELDKLKSAPKRLKALADYGIDMENLSKAEQKILEGLDGELDEETVSKIVEEFDLPLIAKEEIEGEQGSEKPAAQVVAEAARRSGERVKVPQVKPSDVSEWSMEKKLGFAEKNPDAWEALKRGETVTGVAV